MQARLHCLDEALPVVRVEKHLLDKEPPVVVLLHSLVKLPARSLQVQQQLVVIICIVLHFFIPRFERLNFALVLVLRIPYFNRSGV